MNLTIRRMQDDDLQAVHRLETAIFKDPWTYNNFKSEIENNKFSYPCVMLADQSIIGYAVVWYFSTEVHISNFAIHPDHRKKGLGERLLNHILHKFKTYETAYLEVRRSNMAAINLYSKYAFKTLYTRTAYYSDGEDALVMVKYLNI